MHDALYTHRLGIIPGGESARIEPEFRSASVHETRPTLKNFRRVALLFDSSIRCICIYILLSITPTCTLSLIDIGQFYLGFSFIVSEGGRRYTGITFRLTDLSLQSGLTKVQAVMSELQGAKHSLP